MEVSILQTHGVITVKTPYCKTMLFLDSCIEMEQRSFIVTKLCSLSYYYDHVVDQLRPISRLSVDNFKADKNGDTILSDDLQAIQFVVNNSEKIENLLRYYDIKLGTLYSDEYNDYYSSNPDTDPRYKDLVELHFRIKSFFEGDITQERLDEICTIPLTKSARN